MTSTSSPSTPGEGTAWTDADRDRVWPEGWLKCPLHPDQHGDVYHSANWHEDRPPASGEGTRQRPGGWVEGIGWVAKMRDLAAEDRVAGASGSVSRAGTQRALYPWTVATVTRWADGTSPAPPAPLTPTPQAAAITAEMLRAAETHHGDSCSYCNSAADIDCPTAAILDALAAISPAPGDNP